MKNLSLRTLIPLAAASTLVAIGCGGQATDGAVGDGDGDGPSPGGPGSDPLSDANFPNELDSAVDDYCRNARGCDGYDSTNDCANSIRTAFDLVYDTESRDCRRLMLATFECVNESWEGCYSYGDECEGLVEDLTDECIDYNYSEYSGYDDY